MSQSKRDFDRSHFGEWWCQMSESETDAALTAADSIDEFQYEKLSFCLSPIRWPCVAHLCESGDQFAAFHYKGSHDIQTEHMAQIDDRDCQQIGDNIWYCLIHHE